MKPVKPKDAEAYIAGFPEHTQELLRQMRALIRKNAPDAVEVISYSMPAYKLNGMLLYFAGYAKHIGFYPYASAIQEFKEEIAGYKWAKGSVQFPLDKPLPKRLIARMIKFRVEENLSKVKKKK